MRFYLEQAPKLVTEVGYVALPADIYALVLARFDRGVTGTVYTSEHTAGALSELYTIQ